MSRFIHSYFAQTRKQNCPPCFHKFQYLFFTTKITRTRLWNYFSHNKCSKIFKKKHLNLLLFLFSHNNDLKNRFDLPPTKYTSKIEQFSFSLLKNEKEIKNAIKQNCREKFKASLRYQWHKSFNWKSKAAFWELVFK